MDRIQVQASKLWELLFSDETAQTYQTTLNLTGTILKETAQLIWLIICSVFVFGAWVSDTSVKTGNNLRTWIDEQGAPSTAAATDPNTLADTGKNLLDSGRTWLTDLLSQAREQLGLEPLPSTPVKKKIEPRPAAQPKPTVEAEPQKTEIQKTEALAPSPTPSPVATETTAAKPATTSFASSSTAIADVSDVDDDEAEDDISQQAADDDWPPQEEE